MTMEQIDFFLMTVRCDTFLEAAENLHIAQSTLSKQIQKLESELNLTLFDRTRRQAVLTPAGELLHGTDLHLSSARKPQSSPASIIRCCRKCATLKSRNASRSASALFRF